MVLSLGEIFPSKRHCFLKYIVRQDFPQGHIHHGWVMNPITPMSVWRVNHYLFDQVVLFVTLFSTFT